MLIQRLPALLSELSLLGLMVGLGITSDVEFSTAPFCTRSGTFAVVEETGAGDEPVPTVLAISGSSLVLLCDCVKTAHTCKRTTSKATLTKYLAIVSNFVVNLNKKRLTEI